ncbi:hypothetical protein AMC87_PD00396 (plasmid) [Rhizobium phaseoli]|nr:hypothetical protein AMC87_PD00396 [Rhizobium phaseoli]EGE59253.1 hypothetical protein RHECNPAF_2330069 [Rhizobium etli CNPAF512]
MNCQWGMPKKRAAVCVAIFSAVQHFTDGLWKSIARPQPGRRSAGIWMWFDNRLPRGGEEGRPHSRTRNDHMPRQALKRAAAAVPRLWRHGTWPASIIEI